MKTDSLRDDRGVALVVVMGVIALLTIVATGGYLVAGQTLFQAKRVEHESDAFLRANSGLDYALGLFDNHGYLASDYPLVVASSDGTFTVTVTPGSNSEYTVTSVGQGQSGGSSTVKERFFFINLWEMNISSGEGDALTAGGGSWEGTSWVDGPFYCRIAGPIQMKADFLTGPLFLKGADGSLSTQGNATIGTSTKPIDIYVEGSVSGNVYAKTLSHNVPDITLPRVDSTYLAEKAQIAKDQSIDNVMGESGSSTVQNVEADLTNANPATTYTTVLSRLRASGATTFYKYVGGDAIAQPGEGTHNLTIAVGGASFGAWNYIPPGGTSAVSDDFAFDASTGTLYINGTVFIDGDLIFGGTIYYVGNGTIVANGDITIPGDLRPASGNMDVGYALGLVTPTTISIGSGGNANPRDASNPDVCGAFFAQQKIEFLANSMFKGSIISAEITSNHPNTHMITDPLLPTYLPRSMPGLGAGMVTLAGWSRK